MLSPNMKDVVKKKILKLLKIGIIYPIFDSKWASLLCLRKWGMIVVKNENNELIPTWTMTG